MPFQKKNPDQSGNKPKSVSKPSEENSGVKALSIMETLKAVSEMASSIQPKFDIAAFKCWGVQNEKGVPFRDVAEMARWNEYIQDGWYPVNFQWNSRPEGLMIILFRKDG
jgi:hypothetical protein